MKPAGQAVTYKQSCHIDNVGNNCITDPYKTEFHELQKRICVFLSAFSMKYPVKNSQNYIGRRIVHESHHFLLYRFQRYNLCFHATPFRYYLSILSFVFPLFFCASPSASKLILFSSTTIGLFITRVLIFSTYSPSKPIKTS